MDEQGIAKVCATLGLDFTRAYAGTATWGSHMSISCPLAITRHGDPNDKNASCSVKVNDVGPSKAKCWSGNCNYRGNFLNLIRLAVIARGSPEPLAEMLKEVESVEGVTLKSKLSLIAKKVEQEQKWVPPDPNIIPEEKFTPFAGKVPKYAMDRGITLEAAKRWGLGYDKEGGYLVFPVRRLNGDLVGMVGRAVRGDKVRRHHNYAGLDKSRFLYGEHLLEVGKPVVITESCIDTINTWQALEGNACVVATLGEGFSPTHVTTLATMRPPFVYIFTDGDQGGRLIASKIAYALHGSVPVKLMECPWGPLTDPGDGREPFYTKVDPSNLPPDYVRRLFASATVVGRVIKWTNPPPVYNPAAAIS